MGVSKSVLPELQAAVRKDRPGHRLPHPLQLCINPAQGSQAPPRPATPFFQAGVSQSKSPRAHTDISGGPGLLNIDLGGGGPSLSLGTPGCPEFLCSGLMRKKREVWDERGGGEEGKEINNGALCQLSKIFFFKEVYF